MSRTKVEVFAGGIRAGVEFYRHNPAPNLIIVESRAPNDAVLAELNELAEFCDPGTRVMVIGYSNDIRFYRELMQRGVNEYVVAPTNAVSLVAAISSIYRDVSSGKLGQVYAFVGTKGGVGSSTIAHNVGWTIARNFASDVVLADLDLPFGTAGLNLNVDAHQGIAEAIQDSSRLDEVLLDRLLTKCDDHFSLLTAPGTLDASYDLDENAFTSLLEIAQANVPFTILDIPHLWTSWARNALIAADEIVITAVPDLANLRNTKNIIDFLKQARPHDSLPKLVLNQVGMAKRPEIKPAEFARALQIDPIACIPFDAQLFGLAANNGNMIANSAPKSAVAQSFANIAAAVAGRKEPKKEQKSILHKLRALVGAKKQKN
jgi:pilus assembly protein CpaE